MRHAHPHPFERISSVIWIMGTVLLLGMLAWVVPSHAQTDAELRVGFYTGPDAVSFGGGMLTSLTGAPGWEFNPNVEVAIGDYENVISINPDFHYDFPNQSDFSYWMGAGPAVLFVDRDGRDTNTDIGLNLFAGLGARYGAARPFVQMKGVVANDSRVAIQGGIRF